MLIGAISFPWRTNHDQRLFRHPRPGPRFLVDHSHRVVRLTEARVGIEDGLWLNRIEMEKDGRTASGHVVSYKDRRDAEDFCRKRALTG